MKRDKKTINKHLTRLIELAKVERDIESRKRQASISKVQAIYVEQLQLLQEEQSSTLCRLGEAWGDSIECALNQMIKLSELDIELIADLYEYDVFLLFE